MKFQRLFTIIASLIILFSAAMPSGLVSAAQNTADLQVLVTPDPSPIAGVGYTITVINNSPNQAENVVVQNQLDPALDWKVDSASCGINAGGLLTCKLGNLRGKTKAQIHVSGESTAQLTCGSLGADVTATAANAQTASASAELQMLGCNPLLSMEKTASAAVVAAGQPISYTLRIANTGGIAADDVIVRDTLPVKAGLAWTIAAPVPAGCAITAGVLVCNILSFPKGTSRSITVTSPTSAESCGVISNTATVESSNEPSLQLEDNTSTAEITVTCPGPTGTNVSVSKVAEVSTVGLDEPVQFTLQVSNIGSVAADNVTLTDVLPVHAGLAWSIVTPVAGCAIAPDAITGVDTLTCDFGTLAAGASSSVMVSSNAGAGSCGTVSNTASVTAAGEPTENLVDNTANASVTVNCGVGVNVSLLKTTEKPIINQGEPIIFTMLVSNDSQQTAQGVVLTDPLPNVSGLDWSIVAPVAGCAIARDLPTSVQTLTCNFGDLVAGDSRTVQVSSPSSTTAGHIANTATVSATNETAGNEGDNTSSAQLEVPILACLNLNLFDGMYSNTFENSLPGQIGVQNYTESVAPRGQQFMGEYGNQTVTLTVGCMPPHTRLHVAFDLYIIRTWDGNSTTTGPDHWKMELEGRAAPLIDTTFSNWVFSKQSFPGTFPNDQYNYQTGAETISSLGYVYGNAQKDAVYHISMFVDSSSELATFIFTGSGLQTLDDESWGLDNITVAPVGNNNLYLPIGSY